MSKQPTETQRLLGEIEEFLARTGTTASALGHATARDGKVVDRLRRGHTVRLTTAGNIREFMRDPDGYRRANPPPPKKRPKKPAGKKRRRLSEWLSGAGTPEAA